MTLDGKGGRRRVLPGYGIDHEADAALQVEGRKHAAHRNADSSLRSRRRFVLKPHWLPADRSVGSRRPECRADCSAALRSSARPPELAYRLPMARSAALLPPTTDHHRCAALPQPTGSVPGSRRSAVAGEPDFCLSAGLLRPPVRLRGPRCFSTYTLYGVCLDVNRGRRAIFETSQTPAPDARVGFCQGGFRSHIWKRWPAVLSPARAVQAAAIDRPHEAPFRR